MSIKKFVKYKLFVGTIRYTYRNKAMQ